MGTQTSKPKIYQQTVGSEQIHVYAENMNISNDELRTSYPALSELKRLFCSGCPSLSEIGASPKLVYLDCSACIRLPRLPAFSNLQILVCFCCHKLEEIPSMSTLTALDCRDCTGLKNIEPMPQLKSLRCSGCISLELLPETPQLDHLSCFKCSLLLKIPAMTSLTYLDCRDCPWLSEVVRPPLDQSDGYISIQMENDQEKPGSPMYIAQGCPCLPNTPDYDHQRLQKIILLQRWWKKQLFLARLFHLINSSFFNDLYYTPPRCGKGYALSLQKLREIA